VVSVALAVVCGIGVASQSRVNGALGEEMHDGFAAALISFGSGLLIMIIAMAFWRRGRRGLRQVVTAVRTRAIPFWYLLGGAGGAALVLSQGLVAGILGVALFTIGIVAGQTIGGLVVDRRGLGTMRPNPLTLRRLLGAILALVAVGIAVSAQLGGPVPFWMLILPFIAGCATSWQQAVNGQVRAVAESAATATLINFTTGTLVLAIAFVIDSIASGWPTRLPSEPWMYIGGAIGVFFIAVSAMVVRTIGVLLLSLATISGQLIASLVIDAIFPAEDSTIAITTILGTLLTLVAVAVTAWPKRRAKTR
jgi:transporter family-2 protein